jgi:large subunit ribosomal protein L5
MQIPTLEKIVVNVGLGEAVNDAKAIEGAVADLATITGQKPRVNRARKSIAGFKLREGMPIGAKVTLRGDRMWEFFDRLLSVALPACPRLPRAESEAFDGRGNYTFGLVEQLVFPEIDYDSVDSVRGMDITIVTTATDDEHGRALLDAFGFPLHGRRTTADRARPLQLQVTERRWRRSQRSRPKAREEVPRAGLHALPALWPPARGVPPVCVVPRVFPWHGAPRRTARYPQGELVATTGSAGRTTSP